MKQYSNPTYSTTKPEAIEITDTRVFVASNIEQSTQLNSQEEEIQCWKYTLTEYTKDEYILLMAQNNADIAALQEELHAAKILLGVE